MRSAIRGTGDKWFAWAHLQILAIPNTREARAATRCRAFAARDTSIERLVAQLSVSHGDSDSARNDRRYPGHPDIVLPKYHTIVFVNGCFWHMHEGCPKFKMPGSNVGFWTAKLTRNRERDGAQHEQLRAMGWRVIGRMGMRAGTAVA